jgi:hypothetical protein
VEELGRDRSIFYMTIGTIFIVALVMILGGLAMVAAASQSYRIQWFGLVFTSTSLGLIAVALGSLIMFLLYRHAMPKIKAILAPPAKRARD